MEATTVCNVNGENIESILGNCLIIGPYLRENNFEGQTLVRRYPHQAKSLCNLENLFPHPWWYKL